jgi:hypothetical protein
MNETEFKLLLNEKLCDVADAILHYYNPCNLKENACLLTDDMENDSVACCHFSKYDNINGERKCQFWNGKCGFRNINCKIFLCATAIQTNPECVEDLKNLEIIAARYGLTRKPFLGQRYVGMAAELEKLKNKKS